MVALRDDSTAAYEEEQRELATISAGIVADLETIRLVKNDKAEREFREYEAAKDENRTAYADRARDTHREHNRVMQTIEMEFDKDKTHYEGAAQIRRDAVVLKFAKLREGITEKVVVEGIKRGTSDDQRDFGTAYTYDQHKGMEVFAAQVTGKMNEHRALHCADTLLESWKARVSERSRSRERKTMLARDKGMAQRWSSIGQSSEGRRDNQAASSGNLKGSSEYRASSKGNKLGTSIERRPVRDSSIQRELRDTEGLVPTGKAHPRVNLQPSGKGKAPPAGIRHDGFPQMPPPRDRDAPGSPTHRTGRSGLTPPPAATKGGPTDRQLREGEGRLVPVKALPFTPFAGPPVRLRHPGPGNTEETDRDYELRCLKERRDDDVFGFEEKVPRDISMMLRRNPMNYDLAITREKDVRGDPVGTRRDGEPPIFRGVTRVRGRDGEDWVMDRSTWTITARPEKLQVRRLMDGVRSVLIGGRRSYTTLKLEGLQDEEAPRDVARELRHYGPINFLYFKRESSDKGFSGEGYVNFVFANDAFRCMRVFEKKNDRGRLCFARPCQEEMNVQAMNRDESSHFAATLTGNEDIIFRVGDDEFGMPNFGKPTHAQLKGKGRAKSQSTH